MLARWTDRLPPLHGELTTLREVAASDVYPLFTLFSNPEVTAYMAPPPPTLAKFAGFVEWSQRERAQGHGICFGIVPEGVTAAVRHPAGPLRRFDVSRRRMGIRPECSLLVHGRVFRRGQRAHRVCVHQHARQTSRSAHRFAQSAGTRRNAKTRCAVRIHAPGLVTKGRCARSRDRVDPAGT